MDAIDDKLIRLTLPEPLHHIVAGKLALRALKCDSVAAATYLTPAERTNWEGLSHEGRRREWLGARICLKSLIPCEVARSNPQNLILNKNNRGRPWMATSHGEGVEPIGDCTLSHSADWAAAAWTPHSDVQIGIDIECMTPRLKRAEGAFVSPVDSGRGMRSELEQLAIWWALKEAASKAWGQGLGTGLAEIACRELHAGWHSVRHTDGRSLFGWHECCEDSVVAICTTTPPDQRSRLTSHNREMLFSS